jgi:hypothetical protein
VLARHVAPAGNKLCACTLCVAVQPSGSHAPSCGAHRMARRYWIRMRKCESADNTFERFPLPDPTHNCTHCIHVSSVPGSTLFNVWREGIKRAQNERWVKCLQIRQVYPTPCMTTLLRGSLSLNPHMILRVASSVPGSTLFNV